MLGCDLDPNPASEPFEAVSDPYAIGWRRRRGSDFDVDIPPEGRESTSSDMLQGALLRRAMSCMIFREWSSGASCAGGCKPREDTREKSNCSASVSTVCACGGVALDGVEEAEYGDVGSRGGVGRA